MKFKPGPARLRDGTEAVIFEVTDTVIFAKARAAASSTVESYWYVFGRNPDGTNYVGAQHSSDLMPNAEPIVVEFETKTICGFASKGPGLFVWLPESTSIEFLGKAVRVRIEVLDE